VLRDRARRREYQLDHAIECIRSDFARERERARELEDELARERERAANGPTFV
jgi:hypothetical protein